MEQQALLRMAAAGSKVSGGSTIRSPHRRTLSARYEIPAVAPHKEPAECTIAQVLPENRSALNLL